MEIEIEIGEESDRRYTMPGVYSDYDSIYISDKMEVIMCNYKKYNSAPYAKKGTGFKIVDFCEKDIFSVFTGALYDQDLDGFIRWKRTHFKDVGFCFLPTFSDAYQLLSRLIGTRNKIAEIEFDEGICTQKESFYDLEYKSCLCKAFRIIS